MEQYGLTSDEVADSIERDGFLSTMIKLREAFGDNEEDFTRVIGSIEGLSAVLSLTGENVAVNTDIIAQMTDGIGILDEAMGITAETAQFKFDAAMATARDSLLEIGLAIIEGISPHLDTFKKWMDQNGPAIEEAFIKIFEAVNKFITSEALANIATRFAEMWPDIEKTVTQLMDMAGTAVPLLLDAVEKILPSLRDMASIIDDISFFIDEAVTGFGTWGEDTPFIVDFLERQLNPMRRVRDALKAIADTLDAVRRAYERLTNSGFDIGSPATDVPLKGRRAGGGPVAGGGSYLVGEMGPEIFTPAAGGGSITANKNLGGSTINITVNAGMGVGNGAQLGEAIVSAIRKYERVSGPVFASV
jgi:hypothetical protein